jgi:TrmH family RNA methyltransferase
MIESPKNELLKKIRRLKRFKEDLAVLEGPHLIGEAIAAGIRFETLLMTPEFAASGDTELLERLPLEPHRVSARALRSVTDSETPRGLLATVHLPRGGAEELPRRDDGVYVYVAGIQDPGNLGAVARAAEATRVDGLALGPGSVHPNHPRALRASAGSLLRLPVALNVSVEAVSEHLDSVGPTWLALSTTGETDLFKAALAPPLVLVVGSERGLATEVEKRCDARLRIETAKPVESLNTAVAAALALFEVRRR